MGSGEDDVSENRVTFMDGLFIGVFFVGAAGTGLLVISAVTEARLSLTACLALIAGGFVLLALLFSTLAMNPWRLKQEAVLKTWVRVSAAGKELERWEGYELEFISGHVGGLLLFLFAGLGMFGFIIGGTLMFSTEKPDSDLIFGIYFAVGFLLITVMII